MKAWYRRIFWCACFLLISSTLVGCSEERVVSDDPEVIEKQRQEHLDMTRRELTER